MKDFLVSYNLKDRPWAEWIAWQLETAGYKTIIMSRDYIAGTNFVLEMQNAVSEASRVITILSRSYVSSSFTQSEWIAAFSKDPRGRERILLPVRVEDFELEGFLSTISFIDLVGLDEDEACKRLIEGVSFDRSKPSTIPEFPNLQSDTPKFPVILPKISNIRYTRNPYLHGVSIADSINALENLFRVDISPLDVAAIIIEPVQGEGGVYTAPSILQLR